MACKEQFFKKKTVGFAIYFHYLIEIRAHHSSSEPGPASVTPSGNCRVVCTPAIGTSKWTAGHEEEGTPDQLT